MDLKKHQTLVREFCTARDWDQFHDPKELAIGLVTEASELLQLFRFLQADQMREVLTKSREDVSDELADIYYFLLRFTDRFGFDLDRCLRAKLAKNELKYPVELARSKNVKYDKLSFPND